jgi:hypothetical protein
MSKHRTTEDIFEPMYDVNSGENSSGGVSFSHGKEEASLEQDGMARCELSRQKGREVKRNDAAYSPMQRISVHNRGLSNG